MKIFVYILIGIIVLTALFSFFGISSISAGFDAVISEIPFVDSYISVTESVFKMTLNNNIKSPFNIFEDIQKSLFLACFTPMVLYALNLIFLRSNKRGEQLESLLDSLSYKIKQFIINMIGLIITVLFVSSMMTAIQTFLFAKIGNIFTYSLQTLLSIGLFSAGMLYIKIAAGISLFMAFGFTLINTLLKNALKIFLLQLIFVVTYLAAINGIIVAFLPVIIMAAGIMMIVDSVCGLFTKKWVAKDKGLKFI